MKTDLLKMSAQELIQETKKSIARERASTSYVLHCLLEIEDRKLFLEKGFSSLFEFVVQEFGYSESAAYRRIQAMRLMRSFPAVENQIQDGSLSISNAAQLQTFFRDHSRQKEIRIEEKLDLIQIAQNKSSRDFKKELVKRNPDIVVKETLREINELEYELKMIIDGDLKNKLDHLKHLRAHKNPQMPYRELVSDLSELGLKKWDPTSTTVRTQKLSNLEDHKMISRALKKAIWLRDQGCCSFVDPGTKKRCGSRHLLQVDHIHPAALGGKNNLENLRLLCSAHNQRRAELTFGWKPQTAKPSGAHCNSVST